jgi:hypothetical protein
VVSGSSGGTNNTTSTDLREERIPAARIRRYQSITGRDWIIDGGCLAGYARGVRNEAILVHQVGEGLANAHTGTGCVVYRLTGDGYDTSDILSKVEVDAPEAVRQQKLKLKVNSGCHR